VSKAIGEGNRTRALSVFGDSGCGQLLRVAFGVHGALTFHRLTHKWTDTTLEVGHAEHEGRVVRATCWCCDGLGERRRRGAGVPAWYMPGPHGEASDLLLPDQG